MTEAGAPAASRLIDLGLVEGSANTHPGQGTRNRRFFFERGMLELLWVHDAHEARRGRGRSLALWQRWSQRSAPASPFGVCLRRLGMRQTQPFAGCAYRPVYLPREWHILVADHGTDCNQPLCFYLPFADPPGTPGLGGQPRDHRVGLRRITGVLVSGPLVEPASGALAAIAANSAVQFERRPDHCMHIEFDDAIDRRQADLRPHLPLVLRW